MTLDDLTFKSYHLEPLTKVQDRWGAPIRWGDILFNVSLDEQTPAQRAELKTGAPFVLDRNGIRDSGRIESIVSVSGDVVRISGGLYL